MQDCAGLIHAKLTHTVLVPVSQNTSIIPYRNIEYISCIQSHYMKYSSFRYGIICALVDMKQQSDQQVMRPLDVAVLLKITTYSGADWKQQQISKDLHLSQSEISKSVARSKYAGLLDETGKQVRKLALMDFLEKGIAYVFPQRPGEIVRGMPTSHSAAPLAELIQSEENYVWPCATGKLRGQSVMPLYPQVPEAVSQDPDLHALLALVDALRVGQRRERMLAIGELKKRVLDEE